MTLNIRMEHENSNGRVINNTELLGLLAYNQAYFAMKREDYEEAYRMVLVALAAPVRRPAGTLARGGVLVARLKEISPAATEQKRLVTACRVL